jgi:hypothetical protein
VTPNAISWLVAVPLALAVTAIVFISDKEGWGPWPTIGLAFAVLIVGAGAYAIWYLRRKKQRAIQIPKAMAPLGLHPIDPVAGRAVAALPFGLFTRGSNGTVENTVGANVGDRTITMFDYQYSRHGYNARTGSSTEHTFEFSCGVVSVPGSLPSLSIDREGVLSRVARAIGIEDVETGDEAFDRAFKVRAEDPAAARDLLTPDLRAFLLSVDDRWSFEIRAGWLLCWAKQLPVRELGDLHDVAWRCVAKLPAWWPSRGRSPCPAHSWSARDP